MATIDIGGLYSNGRFAMIDDKNVEMANVCKWHYDIKGQCAVGRVNGIVVKLQRYIMGITDRNMLVLFRDGNNMNCVESNLEIVSKREYQQKTMNARKANGTLVTRGEAQKIKKRIYEREERKDWLW